MESNFEQDLADSEQDFADQFDRTSMVVIQLRFQLGVVVSQNLCQQFIKRQKLKISQNSYHK